MNRQGLISATLIGATLATMLIPSALGQTTPTTPAPTPSATPTTASRPVWVGLTVGKDTTLLTEPLRKDGTVDYIAALNERFGKGVTPENNAFVGLLPAMGAQLDSLAHDTAFISAAGGNPNEKGCYVDPTANDNRSPEAKALIDKYYALQAKPWKPEEAPDLDKLLAANDPCLAIIRAATRRPRFWIPLASSNGFLSGTSRGNMHLAYRKAGELLCLHAMRAVATGNLGEAWEDLSAAHRLINLIAQDYDNLGLGLAILNEVRVLICERFLLANLTDAKLLTHIISDLESYPALPQITEVCRRYSIYEYPDALQLGAEGFKQGIDANLPKNDQATTSEVLHAFGLWLPDWDRMAKFGNSFYVQRFADPDLTKKEDLQKWIATTRASIDVIRQASDKDGQNTDEFLDNPLSAVFLMPRKGETQAEYSDRFARRIMMLITGAIESMELRGLSVQKELELMKVAYAVQLFHAETGAYPETAEVAARKYLKAVPTDFWGKPITYTRTEKGFKIESLGLLADTREEAVKRGALIVIEVPAPWSPGYKTADPAPL